MKNKVVVFSENGARILINPDENILSGLNYLVNPDLTLVKGLDLHYWKREGDFVVPMSEDERSSMIISHDLPSVPIIEKIVEVVKEVPVEVIKEVQVEVIKEVPVEKFVDRIVEKPYPVEKIIERVVEVPKEIIKEVEVIKEVIIEKQVPVEVIKYKTNEITRLVWKETIPKWLLLTLGVETFALLVFLTTYFRGLYG